MATTTRDHRPQRGKSALRRGGFRPSPALLGMLAATLLVSLGLFSVYSARLERLTQESVQTRTLVRTLLTPELLDASLEPIVDNMAERHFVAERLHQQLQSMGGPGALKSLTPLRRSRVRVADIDANSNLPELRQRLEDLRRSRARQSLNEPEQLSLLGSAQYAALRRQLAVRSVPEYKRGILRAAALLLLGLWLPFVMWRVRRQAVDPWLAPLALALSGLGLCLMISLRHPLRDELLHGAFAIGVFLGGLLMAAVSQIRFQRFQNRSWHWQFLAAALAISACLLWIGEGPRGTEAKVNLRFGGVTLQPVEAVKLLMVLFMAGYLARHGRRIRDLRIRLAHLPRWARWLEPPRLRDFLPLAVAILGSFGFLFLQKDLGPALVIVLTFLALYSTASVRPMLAILGATALMLGGLGVWWLQTPNTVYTRMVMVLRPWDNLRRFGDQLANGLWAFAAGGLSGTGLGRGETYHVPAAHTDFVLGVAGEELGFLGLTLILALYTLLIWRGFRIAGRQPEEFTLYLAAGVCSLLAVQLTLIGAGVMGLAPLSGVTTPLLSYGKSSQLMVFAILGILASLSIRASHAKSQSSERAGGHRELASAPGADTGMARARPQSTEVPAGVQSALLPLETVALLACVCLWARAGQLQLIRADEIMARPILAVQAGNEVGFVINPRLRNIARSIPRGIIYDRNQVPLALNREDNLPAHREALAGLGIEVRDVCATGSSRCYPFGGLTYHLLGDLNTRLNWSASNTAFVEREEASQLRGFDDHAQWLEVVLPNGRTVRELRRNYGDLLPLWWHRRNLAHEEARAILDRDRDIHLSLDIALQQDVDRILAGKLESLPSSQKGTVVVENARSGAILALVNRPYPRYLGAPLRRLMGDDPVLLDRARFGVYPPGSTFKLVTAMAALRSRKEAAYTRHACIRLPDGRVGTIFDKGRRKLYIRDDPLDRVPHGSVEMLKGLKVSCNGYFSQLAVYEAGAGSLYDTAKLFDITLADPDTPEELSKYLEQSSFGQAEVLARPIQMIQVAATIANRGMLHKPTLIPSLAKAEGIAVLPWTQANFLARAMREVVTDGTARSLNRKNLPAIGGKTGTAQVAGRGSHAWFLGFAPYALTSSTELEGGSSAEGVPERVAVVALIEGAGYGGRHAAPVVGAVFQAAAARGYLGSEAEGSSREGE